MATISIVKKGYFTTYNAFRSKGNFSYNLEKLNDSLSQNVGSSYSLDVVMDQFNLVTSAVTRQRLTNNGDVSYNMYIAYFSGTDIYWNPSPIFWPQQEQQAYTNTIVNTRYTLWKNGAVVGGTVGARVSVSANSILITPTAGIAPNKIRIWIEANFVIYNPFTDQTEITTAMLTSWDLNVDTTLGDAPVNADLPDWLNNPTWWQMIYAVGTKSDLNGNNIGLQEIYQNQTPYTPTAFATWNITNTYPYQMKDGLAGIYAPFILSTATSGYPPSFSLQVQLGEQDIVYNGNTTGSPLLWFQIISLPPGNQNGITIANFAPTFANNTITTSNSTQTFTFRYADSLDRPLLALITAFDVITNISITATFR